MGEILLWAARCKGPVSHFWFQHNSTYRRVCDGELWPKGSPVELDGEALPCRSCKELYVEDVVCGGQVLTLATSDFTPNEPSCDGVQALHSGVVPGYNGVEPHRNGVSPLSKGFGMLRIALSQFANFYEARPAGQVRIVRQVREQLASSEMFRRHNFWGFFHDQLRRTHLASGDIRDFEDRLPAFVSNLADARKQHPYMELGRAYIDFWKSRSGELFVPEPVAVEIDELQVRVRPEVGIRDGQDVLVLQLWFKNKKPGRQARQVIHHFLERARSQSPVWHSSWNIGIWDVRNRDIPQPIRAAQDFEVGLEGLVASFLRIWARLDDEGP